MSGARKEECGKRMSDLEKGLPAEDVCMIEHGAVEGAHEQLSLIP